jgi:hypothetical protein
MSAKEDLEPSKDPEDLRAAINMSVALSGQLITAGLTMLTVAGAVWTFILDKRNAGPLFYIVALLSAVSFIGSIMQGGWGITRARDAGFRGKWSTEEGKSNFNNQAILCVLGLLLFVLSLFHFVTGATQESEANGRIDGVVANIAQLQASLKALKDSDADRRIDELSQRMTKLELEAEALQVAHPANQNSSNRSNPGNPNKPHSPSP